MTKKKRTRKRTPRPPLTRIEEGLTELTMLVQDLADTADESGCTPDLIVVGRSELAAVCKAFGGQVAYYFSK